MATSNLDVEEGHILIKACDLRHGCQLTNACADVQRSERCRETLRMTSTCRVVDALDRHAGKPSASKEVLSVTDILVATAFI